MGDNAQQSPPQASFDFEFEDNSGNDILRITHNSGKAVDNDDVYVSPTKDIAAGPGNDSASITNQQQSIDLTSEANSNTWVDENLKAGVSFELVGDGDLGSETVRLIYENDGQSTTTIATWEGPDA